MIRTVKTAFNASNEDIDYLFFSNRTSAEVWNYCLVVAKEYSLANDGKWINKILLRRYLRRSFL
ncbi:MAG: hypothetical protein JW702_02910 [Clostridiales bacterium]|nr:hypothetical protein [Clostridiales bacterium]